MSSMRKTLFRLPALLLLVLLAACAEYTLVKPGSRVVGDTFEMHPQVAWSRSVSHGVETWTIDGPLLESLQFFPALGDGDRLFPNGGGEDRPIFKKGMREPDIADLVVGSLRAAGASRIETKQLRPVEFGGKPGFRFELAYLAADGLAYEGLAFGQIDEGGHLHLILYTGAQQHYFAKRLDNVENLLASIRLL